MARFYKAPNKRLIPRAASGRFRQGTIADFGMSCCEKCGTLWFPDYSKLPGYPNMVDPRDWRRAEKECPTCKETADAAQA